MAATRQTIESVAARLRTDSILHYVAGGEIDNYGLAVPNWSDDVQSVNETLVQLVELTGQNLLLIMTGNDARMSTAPFIDTIRLIHSLYVRFGNILNAAARKPNQSRFQGVHATPQVLIPKVYPIPFYNVRNRFLKEMAGLILGAMTEMLQHSENAIPYDISEDCAKGIWKFFKRAYEKLATGLFGIAPAEAEKPDFLLTEEQLSAYNPSAVLSSVERIDTVADISQIMTEDMMRVIRYGIPVNELPDLQPFSQPVLGTSNTSTVTTQPTNGAIFSPTNSPAPQFVS